MTLPLAWMVFLFCKEGRRMNHDGSEPSKTELNSAVLSQAENTAVHASIPALIPSMEEQCTLPQRTIHD